MQRIFLFKFAKPDHKEQLIIDSGFRCHLTSFARATAAAPSAFVTRLRKYLKTRRVTSIAQVGTDRILEFQFSDGLYRLFFEFYAGGNIVLTDAESKVLAVLRNVSEGAEYEHVSLGSIYNLSERQNYNGVPPLTAERVKEGLRKFVDRQASGDQAQVKKAKKKQADNLRKALAGSISEFPPLLLEHALTATGFDATLQPQEVLDDENLVEKVLVALQEADRVVKDLMRAEVPKGYILAKENIPAVLGKDANTASTEGRTSSNLLYTDFHPFKPMQFENDESLKFLEFDGFNHTVDEFFSSIEGQKLESRLQEREEAARKKLENARLDQANRIGGLQDVQSLNTRKAQAIEANLERVEEATNAVNSLIAQGMDWVEIERLIELEQARHNPVAEIIKLPLKLNENTATLLLGEWEFEEEEVYDEAKEVLTDSEPSDSEDEVETSKNKKKKNKAGKRQDAGKPIEKRLTVDIDLALSGWSNARKYYDQKKTAAVKEEKTAQAATKALKGAQYKIEADLRKGLKQEKQLLRPVRHQHWFEKFIFFISSDGYLVIGGKDAQQSEIIYKRYLKKGDVYVHADLNGAATVVIKNTLGSDAPIPPSTLSQAGNMSVATSVAWDSKAVMSAWWVNADQVSKMAHGEYLTAGNFNINGKKNFLPPAQLLLGFAVMFQVSEESKARHTKHRLPASQDTKSVIEADSRLDDVANDGEESNTLPEEPTEPTEDTADEDVASEAASEVDEEDREVLERYNNPLQNDTRDTDSDDVGADEVEENVLAQQEQSQVDESDIDDAPNTASAAEKMPSPAEQSHSSTASQPKAKAPIPVRGKRGQKKKLAAKYADQDEEDRALAMEILGSRVGQEKAAAEAEEKKAREAEAEAQRQRRREQHLRQQQEGKKAEEARLREQEGAEGYDDDEDEQTAAALADLDAFIGTPMVGDEILEAIPVCAPWSALGRYKFKAKLQPGSTKKGKAVREILGRWTVAASDKRALDESSQDTERIWPREAELIKAWKDTEVFGVLPVGKVRVMMGSAGGSGGAGGKGKASGGGGGGGKRGGRGSKKK